MSEAWTAEQDRAFRAAIDGMVSANGRPEPFALDALTVKATYALPDPPDSDELLGGLLVRRQRTIIGADTGAGKSTIALAMLAAVVTEGEWLGFRGSGGRALVVDAEQGLKTIKKRLREAQLDDCELIDYIRVPAGLSLNDDEQQAAEIERHLAKHNYVAVLADPLYKLHTGDSNDERAAVDLMSRFDDWRERYGFALALLSHTRKPPIGAKFSMHEFFGSSAYLRGAEIILGLQRVRDGYARLHFFKDRDGDLPVGSSWGLLFDRDAGYRRDPTDDKPKETATTQVQALLGQGTPLTPEQIAEATGYAVRTVRRALKEIGAEDARPGSTAEKRWTLLDDSE